VTAAVGLLRPQTQPCPAAATRQQTESAAAVMSPTQSHSAAMTRAPLQQTQPCPAAATINILYYVIETVFMQILFSNCYQSLVSH